MWKYGAGPHPPDYVDDYPPPPPDYHRDCPPLPPDFENGFPPLPPPPRPPCMREWHHRELPPRWDDRDRDYLDAPAAFGGRPPPPPWDYSRHYEEDYAQEWGGYGRGHYHPRGPPPMRARGHYHYRGHGRVNAGRVPGRGCGGVRGINHSASSQNGPLDTFSMPSDATNQTLHTPLKSALKKPGSEKLGSEQHNIQTPVWNVGTGDSKFSEVTTNQISQKLSDPPLKSALNTTQSPSSQKPNIQTPVWIVQEHGLQKSEPGLPVPRMEKPDSQSSALQQSPLQNPVVQEPGMQNPFPESVLQKPGSHQNVVQDSIKQYPCPKQGGSNMATTLSLRNTNQGEAQENNIAVGQSTVIKVHVPGDANFISFKNSLQEYCQKKHLPVPIYTTFKNNSVVLGYSFTSRVAVSKKTFKSIGLHRDRKEAEQNAAFTALKALELISASVEFSTKIEKLGVKRPSPGIRAPVILDAKKTKVEPTIASVAYKSKLNEFCQKFHLPTPKYETVRNSSQGFMTTLVYNNKVYHSTAPQLTKKLAEENAAQLVLSKLNQAPLPEPGAKQFIQTCMQISTAGGFVATDAASGEGSIADLVQAKQPFIVSYKNQLQEHCQKQKISNPVYETFNVQGMFGCKVTVEGKVFTSSNCKTKKGSEQSAARLALQVLGPLPPAPV